MAYPMPELPPELKNAFAPATWDKINAFLQEFVVFTSHERARLDICMMLIDEKKNLLQEQMRDGQPLLAK